MTDVVDTATRSRMMKGIGSAHTRPEIVVRRYLHACGLRFRLHSGNLPGRPDIVLHRYRTAIFVHGCFWHRHEGCRYAAQPKTRVDFWQEKFRRNVERDARKAGQLESAGWRVLVIWECETRDTDALDGLFWRIVAS